MPMSQSAEYSVRTECPPGACVCERARLLADPRGDTRILRLTREEEKRLISRIDSISSYGDLLRVGELLRTQLGVALRITPSLREVRTVRGIGIQLDEQPGLCRKTRAAVPAAVRRCLDRNPDIVYAILNERDLLAAG